MTGVGLEQIKEKNLGSDGVKITEGLVGPSKDFDIHWEVTEYFQTEMSTTRLQFQWPYCCCYVKTRL